MDTTYSGNNAYGNGLGAALPVNDPAPIDTGADNLSITINDDGSIEIGSPEADAMQDADPNFEANLAEKIDSGLLSSLAEEGIEGVQADITSRAGFIDNYNKGLELLGLKIEDSTTVRTQKRNISRVGHPLMLEAVVKFQALARGELLPAFGPCKAAVIGDSDDAQDELAQGLEQDMNYFLTDIDKGYYPDFDRGLFALGYGGNLFKKIYHDPIKRFPVSRSIQIEDFIVSENATDLYDAQRKTHRYYMTAGEIRKMQFVKHFRECDIGDGSFTNDPTKMKQGEIIGLASASQRTQDQEHELYEIYMDIDPERLGVREKGAPKGLPLPYIVTIDTSNRNVYAIRRNWKENDPQFTERRRFVHYGMIPSFGFLCLGYLHLLGNQTRALRAIWRILIDAGMFSSFPGGMKAKNVRTDTNEIAPGPGEWVDIDIGPFDDIKSAFMAMPYKDVSPVFIQLSELIYQDSQRMGGIPEMATDEGRTHIPVGTMMAMVEQATQQMSSVHKRMHSAMQDELCLLKEMFAEDPAALTRLARNPSRNWETAAEFADIDIVPASDPNVPSQTHRIQQAAAIVAMSQNQQAMPYFDQFAVYKNALTSIGKKDWNTVLHQPGPQAQQPNPEAMGKIAELSLKAKQLEFDQEDAKRKAANELVMSQQQQASQAQEAKREEMDLASRANIEHLKQETERMRIAHEQQQAEADHAHEAGLAAAQQQHDKRVTAFQEHKATQREGLKAQAAKEQAIAVAKAKPKPKPAAKKAKP